MRHLALIAAFFLAAAAPAAPAYRPAGSVPLGAPDKWDYTIFDPGSGRVYVAHGDRVAVVDGASGRMLGSVAGIPGGTHGIAIAPHAGVGITDDGDGAKAVAFDLKTFQIVARMPAQDDADAIAGDPVSGHVFVMNSEPGTISVVDPAARKTIATIPVGEKLEYAVADGKGALFVAGAGNRDIVKVDIAAGKVAACWPTPDCETPHGLALDRANARLFLGCVNNRMMVVDAANGRVVTSLAIGAGSDAIAFDPVRKRVFSSNGIDGTITIWQQHGADHYAALELVRTQKTGRTMSVDPKSGRLFVSAADPLPGAAPGARSKPTPGTLKLLMFDPVP